VLKAVPLNEGIVTTSRTVWRPTIPQALRRADVLPTLVVLFAVALIAYLPLEAALIGGLPASVYWVLRLAPDGIVMVLAAAVVLLGDRAARTTPVRTVWAIAAVCVVLVLANAARGISVSDSVNAIRLVIRYLVLGLLVWWALADRPSGGPLIVGSVLLAGLVQVAVATVEAVAGLIHAASGSAGFDLSSVLFVDGSLGRYDRLGLLLMSVAIAVLATGRQISRARFALLVACMVLLFLTTSRQAMAGLAIASILLALIPGVAKPRRAIVLSFFVISVILILVTPRQSAPVGADDPDVIGGAFPSPIASTPPSPIKGGVDLSLDPNRNFRLFYNLELAPWAAVTEPLLGFGPRQQVADQPDPRLVARFEAAGMGWSWARQFTNDSEYASLIVQFGVIAPALILILILLIMARVAATAARTDGGFAGFAVANAAAVLVAAWFGPTLEIRTVSIIFWVALMAAIAASRRTVADH
jgi:hypothetical protein